MGKTTGLDAYRQEATKLFHTTYDKVTPAQRRAAKLYMYYKVYSMKGMKIDAE